MMGLRLSEGIDINSFSEIYNAELNSGKINYLFEDGLLKIKDGKLKITKDGRIFSNLLIEKVTECVSFLN
jgi:coproporphyrinogen III oxidase-like Fe-S oxidoreductase